MNKKMCDVFHQHFNDFTLIFNCYAVGVTNFISEFVIV